MSSPFVTLDEVADLLHKTRSWVYEQTRRRIIPCYGGGKQLVFDPQEVLDWYRTTYARSPQPVSARPRRMLTRRRRRTPNGQSEGHERATPHQTRVSAASAGAIASSVPVEV